MARLSKSRRRRLAALHAENLYLQRLIWALEDAKAEQDALNEADFVSIFSQEDGAA